MFEESKWGAPPLTALKRTVTNVKTVFESEQEKVCPLFLEYVLGIFDEVKAFLGENTLPPVMYAWWEQRGRGFPFQKQTGGKHIEFKERNYKKLWLEETVLVMQVFLG